MSGGTIQGNQAGTDASRSETDEFRTGGGVVFVNDADFMVSGNPKILGNTYAGITNNVGMT